MGHGAAHEDLDEDLDEDRHEGRDEDWHEGRDEEEEHYRQGRASQEPSTEGCEGEDFWGPQEGRAHEEAARGGQEELCGDQKVDRVRQQGKVGTWLEGLRGHQRQEARGQGALCEGQGLVRPGVGSDLEVTRSRQDAWSFMVLCACPLRLYTT